jgi:Na+/H+-dicarboxylate symporter
MRTTRHALTNFIFIGLFAGAIGGIVFGESILPLAEVLAEVFLRLLRMAIMPLIITSIISGVISVGSAGNLGRLGGKTFGYYILSSFMAIITGLILVNIFRPGVGADLPLEKSPETIGAAEQGIDQLLLTIIPENPLRSMVQGDVLPVIFFSVLFAYFITCLPERRRTQMGDFFQAAFEAMMRLTQFVVWTAPLGVFGIMARIVAQTGFSAFKPLGVYFLIVLAGLIIHAFINLPLILRFVARFNPVQHYKNMPGALLTAFSTCSSMVTLPLTMDAVTNETGVSRKVASFTLPIGATINMDGTALYECVATMFIAQVYGIELSIGSQAIVVFTALMASIGAASVPMSGLVMMSIILKAVGLPLEGVALILAVDRVLDMFRTTVNVLSDSVGAVVVARLEGETLNNSTSIIDRP